MSRVLLSQLFLQVVILFREAFYCSREGLNLSLVVAIERVSTMQLLCPGGDNGLSCHDQPFPQTAPTDDAEKFTSEMHDPCTRSRCLQERTTQKHLQGAPVWSRSNTLRRLSQKCFYNSRVLERS